MHVPQNDPSRLARAIQLGLQFRDSGRTDVEAFLREHESLRELLEPIVCGDGQDEAAGPETLASDAGPGTSSPGRHFGPYLLQRELGRGGMGAVYLASQPGLDRRLAVKVVTAPSVLVSERTLLRFQREARLLATLDHPNIVRVVDAGVQDGVPFFAMDWIRGASLAELLAAVRRAGAVVDRIATLRAALLGAVARQGEDGEPDCSPLPGDYVTTVVAFAAEVAEALDHAHEHGVVHRDVKPSNILVRQDGKAMLVDFGVARADDGAMRTATGDLVGTPSYMAPEQLQGGVVDRRTDVWALGATLYEMLTMRLPFVGDNQARVVQQVLQADLVDPRLVDPSVGKDLAAVLHRALTKDPEHRYQSARALAGELRAVLAGQRVQARLPGPLEKLGRFVRRDPWRAMASVVGIATLVAAVAVDQGLAADLRAESRRKQEALAEAHRLSIAVRLDRAVEAARAFRWPDLAAIPALEAWQREHRDRLQAELEPMVAMLERLRHEALPYGSDEAMADREKHPATAVLTRLMDELAAIEAIPADQRSEAVTTRREQLLHDRLALQASIEAGRSWRFAAADRQFLHDEVARTVDRLRAFLAPTGLAAQLANRAAWAAESHRRCIEEAASTWHAVAAELAAEPRFAGWQLSPQRDLLPVGKDPRSGLWEFVHLPSAQRGQELPQRGADGSLRLGDGNGIVFVLLPGGTFVMGAQANASDQPNFDPAAEPIEGPVATVTLAPFFMSKFELTRSQWACLTDGESLVIPTHAKPPGLAPAEGVTQQRALAVLATVGLELPSEAQWEYACRAGTDSPWHFGTRARASQYANFAGKSAPPGAPRDADVDDDGHRHLVDPGTFEPNAFGLHDMHGNVDELTSDRLGHLALRRDDGRSTGQAPFDEARIVKRGGSNHSRLVDCRASRRAYVRATAVMPSGGLRAARSVTR
ncbi:MAG: protein kinase [Planctomycetes bacterium]|nr:protein kinase [Planctomycetota bacterium]